MAKYFKNVKSFEDLKKQYKELLKKNHPDNGGDLEAVYPVIPCHVWQTWEPFRNRDIKPPGWQESECSGISRTVTRSQYG